MWVSCESRNEKCQITQQSAAVNHAYYTSTAPGNRVTGQSVSTNPSVDIWFVSLSDRNCVILCTWKNRFGCLMCISLSDSGKCWVSLEPNWFTIYIVATSINPNITQTEICVFCTCESGSNLILSKVLFAVTSLFSPPNSQWYWEHLLVATSSSSL